jgi:NADPH:quinone reductase-like Zn-dependent oxidoreductase/surfactin synthase thioesterase subunit/acyl carrier protein
VNAGLEALKSEHGPAVGGACHEHRSIYDIINRRKDYVYYGESFQVIQKYSSNRRGSGFAELHFHHEEWSKAKGKYPIQILDGVAQLGFLNPNNSGGLGYFKGFDICHFVRLPEHDVMYAYIKYRDEISKAGGEVVFGDVFLYDPLGRLVLQIFGLKTASAKQGDEVMSAVFTWQPFVLPLQNQTEQAESANQALAAAVLEMANSKAEFLRQNRPPSNDYGPTIVRILEYCVDVHEGPRLLQSLLSIESQPSGVIIELILATDNPEVAHKFDSVPKSKRDWLLLRVACLPMAQIKVHSMSFCAVCLWKSAVTSLWSEPEAALAEAVSVSCPGAILLCEIGQAASEYNKSVESFFMSPVASNKVNVVDNIIQCQIRIGMERLMSSKDHVMVLSSDKLLGKSLQDQLLSKMQTSADNSKCLVPITEEESEGYSEFVASIEKFLMEETVGVVKHVVFLDPALDASRYGSKSFLMVPKLALILQNIQEKVENGTGAKIRLWLVSSNVYNPPINVDHCAILPFPSICWEELPLLQCHLVDVDRSFIDLERVASLILLRPVEKILVVHAERIWRLSCAEGHKKHRTVMVGPDDESLMHNCKLYYDKGKLRHEFFAACPPSPGEGEVLVNIHSSSMNFRDLMLTLDALPEESFKGSFFGKNLGMECAGIVAATGAGVAHIRRGDRVMLSAPSCFASKVVSPASRVLKVPDVMSLESAAAVQSVYMTAYHALINLARVKEGEKVLIHAAAGGVGHAALSICQYLGAEVYATTSDEKRAYVESLGVHQSRIFNSRNLSWYEELMKESGEGVDVVLNSLAKEHQKSCFQALRPGGRMCEIGKVDIYDKSTINLFPFRRNISFHAIDMDRMMTENPDVVFSICEKVVEHLFAGDFRLVPHRSFPMSDLNRAFDLMRSGKHRGKIVLNNFDPDTGNPIRVASKVTLQFGPDEFAVVTGSTGGIGFELVHWLYKRGTRKFLVTTRNGPSEIHSLYSDLISNGAEFDILCLDLSKSADLDTLASHCKTLRHPLRTIVHAAGNYLPTLLPDVNEKILFDHLSLKNDLAAVLHQLSLELGTVNNFFMIGSTSSILPLQGAACYGASNAILAGLARERIGLGLPCTILHMTALSDVGIVTKQQELVAFFHSTGIASTSSSRAIADLEDMAINGLHEMIHIQKRSEVQYHDALSANSAWKVPMMFGQCQNTSNHGVVTTVEDIAESLVEIIKEICGIDNDISLQSLIVDLGMDSMGLLDFEQQVAEKYQVTIDRGVLTKSILEIAKSITKSLKSLVKRSDDGGDANDQNHARSTIDNDGDTALAVVGTANQYDLSNNTMPELLLSFHRELQDPLSYFIIIPGVTGDPRPFNSWGVPGVQIYVVNLSTQDDCIINTADAVSQEMKRRGLLSSKKSISILGFSYGSMVGFHLCSLLVNEYGIEPSKFIAVSSPPPNIRPRLSIKQGLSYVKSLCFRKNSDVIFDILQLSSEELQEAMLLLDESERENMSQMVQDRLSSVLQYIMRTSKQPKPLFICNHMDILSFVGGKDKSTESESLKGWKKFTKGKVSQHKYELCGHYFPTDPYVADDFQNTIENIIRNVSM